MWITAIASAAMRGESLPSLEPEAEGAALVLAETMIKWRVLLESKFKK